MTNTQIIEARVLIENFIDEKVAQGIPIEVMRLIVESTLAKINKVVDIEVNKEIKAQKEEQKEGN